MSYQITKQMLEEMLIPHCAVCNKPVEKFSIEPCVRTYEMLFGVRCHGETEICSVPQHIMDSLDLTKIKSFDVFTTKRIEEK